MVTKRQKRVLNAFYQCVKSGEFNYDYKETYFYNRFEVE